MIYLKLFYEFFIIGLFTFGGGYAMIPLIKETVIANEWLSEQMFYDFIGVCESTPGPIAVNMATYIGSVQGGIFGSICATLGVVLPSFIIILLVASCLKKLIKNKYFQYFLNGVKPIVIGLILSTGLILLSKCLISTNEIKTISLTVFILIFALYFAYLKIFKKKINNILFIILSACIGIFISIVN